jgi:hypothetical protein
MELQHLQARDFLIAPNNPLIIAGKTIDGRSTFAIRYRSLCSEMASDLGGSVSISQVALIRRAAMLMMECEKFEYRSAMGETIDHERYGKVITPLTKILGMLGLTRQARNVTPTDKPGSAWAGLVIDAEGQADA